LIGKLILAVLSVLGAVKGIQVYRRTHGHTAIEPEA